MNEQNPVTPDLESAINRFVGSFALGIVVEHGLSPENQAAIASTITELTRAGRVLVGHIEKLTGQVDNATVRRVQAERKADQAIAARDALIADKAEQPRTIVLTYMPQRWDNGKTNPIFKDPMVADCGGYWTLSEGGRHQAQLDSRETMALVAAMLLGAPHPSLKSIPDLENMFANSARRVASNRVDRLPIRVTEQSIDVPNIASPTTDSDLVYVDAGGTYRAHPKEEWERRGFSPLESAQYAELGKGVAQRINEARNAKITPAPSPDPAFPDD